ncbi:MAG: hypothetical protein AB7E79_02600 [Rhodospirillaceae bacterium]
MPIPKLLSVAVLFLPSALLNGISVAHGADLPIFPNADEKPCSTPGESPECALKTFWMCNEQNVDVCKLIGIELQPEGTQKRDDGSYAGNVWRRPWTMPWSALINEASKEYDVWELRGIREVAHNRIRGLRRAPEPVIGMQEMMIYMVDAKGVIEKASVFMEERRGDWNVVAFARWRDEENIDPCDRKKLRSLACKYSITGMRPW